MWKQNRSELGQRAAFVSAMMTFAASAAAADEIATASRDGEVAIVIDLSVRPGAEGEFEQAFQSTAHCAKMEQGNVDFKIYKVLGQAQQYLFYEVWRSPQALAAHLQQPYAKSLKLVLDRTLQRPAQEGLHYISDLSPYPQRHIDNAVTEILPECR